MYAFCMKKQGRIKRRQFHIQPIWLILLVMMLIFAGGMASAEERATSTPCTVTAARAVSVEGIVERRRSGESQWQRVDPGTLLCQGDWVSVRAHSRAALRFSNDSMLRVDQKTNFIITAPIQKESATLLELLQGRLHILTRTPKPFRIKTPIINAAVEGTEFFIDFTEDASHIVVYEGKVTASNSHGNVSLTDQEAAIVLKDNAPHKVVMVHPVDAVQWALFYPTIIDHRLDMQMVSESARPAWQQVIDHYRQGQLQSALEQMDRIEASEWTARSLIFRAGLLLSIGRVAEARDSIDAALRLEASNSNAFALRATIAVVQNDKSAALALANQAVEYDTLSSIARLALSYAQQAHFDIEAALASVEAAIELNSQSALAWARLAELRMANGDYDRAIEAAHHAVNLNPQLGRTQTVLGFAHLLRIDTRQARAAFERAIALDQADPMPRLGLGLALVREDKLEAGRVEMEIAASLDPANSLVRSYLGKAYFEEKRYGLAETQFSLARLRDPFDPTPWLYDAIQKQTQNRPVEALHNIQKSIELNDNRAVYRSKLLLDQDQAARGSSLARIYDNLGFEKRALMETAKSLSHDPSNHSAHRFLSDAYLNIPRHEIARVSELLQAQLLQPINVNPVQPRLAVADLNIITGTSPSVTGFNEFSPLMERNRLQLVASGIVGSNSTLGDEVVASALFDRASISVGQFHYDTKGFRSNNDQTHNIYNAFVQYAVTPKFNVQAELRRRATEHGNLLLDFDRDSPDPAVANDPSAPNNRLRRELDEDMLRLGMHLQLAPKHSFLASMFYASKKEQKTKFVTPRSNRESFIKDEGYQLEGQYRFLDARLNLLAGFGLYQVDVLEQNLLRRIANPFETGCGGATGLPCEASFEREKVNGYIYSNFKYFPKVNVTAGLAYNSYEEFATDLGHINPKFGLQWDIFDNLRFRFAWFQTTKPALIANQTLEPTQIAGFNQLFDDLNGTRSRRVGVALDTHFRNRIFTGVEISQRKLNVPIHGNDFVTFQKQNENLYQGYAYWTIDPDWIVRTEARFEQFSRQPNRTEPHVISTLSVPAHIGYFDRSGFFASVTGTFVHQFVNRDTPTKIYPGSLKNNEGKENFFLLDASLGFRLPKRRGILSVEAKNLLDQSFLYRNANFYTSEAISPRYLPTRTVFLRMTFNF